MQPSLSGTSIKKRLLPKVLSAVVALVTASTAQAVTEYEARFQTLRDTITSAASGYYSKDGAPYHSVETLLVEAPDHGHESTSEAYSYYLLLEAVHGKQTGDWAPLVAAWNKIEAQAIPTHAMQPTTAGYNPSNPATYVAEGPLPSSYPGNLQSTVPVGVDPIANELKAAYGTSEIYGMHWLFDLDNVYGYGNLGDGKSTPSYINTFQRGVQESVWETVPHPSWENFNWGNKYGFLQLFVGEPAPAKQWRYTNAPDADARAVQVIYWALQWMKEQGKNPEVVAPGLAAKAAKMGDYLRLAMFDKYFKKMGAASESAPGGTGYDSAHYLMSWYYAWGGPIDPSQNWAWRIGSSHVHFGYQNPVAAYALSQVGELTPKSTNGKRDWNTSLGRTLEFYQWLQSAEGAIGGGATNSWNGKYDARPYVADFYGMTYTSNPVYEDPGSGTWYGWQVWSVERLAEYFYISGDAKAKAILDKWVKWSLSTDVLDMSTGDVFVASEIAWTGLPNNWNPAAPQPNTNLHVTVKGKNQDVGVIHSLAKTLMYYSAGVRKVTGADDVASRDAAKQILDIMWTKHRDAKGIAIPESRGDYSRFNEKVFIPAGYTGVNALGASIDQNSTFLSMRPFYLSDPMYQEVLNAKAAGRDPQFSYHRYWAQVEAATANAIYSDLFLKSNGGSSSSSSVSSASSSSVFSSSSKSSVATSASSSIKSSSSSVVSSSSSVVSSSSSVKSSSSLASSSSSSSSSSTGFTQQCNWYGSLYPVCITTTSGWGYEQGQSCISVSTCTAQPAPYGIVGASSSSSVKSSSSSSVVVSSSSRSSTTSSIDNCSNPSYATMFCRSSSSSSSSSSSVKSSSSSSSSSSVPVVSSCQYVVTNEWNTGFTAAVRITNKSAVPLNGWSVSWKYTDGSQVTNLWNANLSGVNPYSATGLSWNSVIQPGQTAEFGFQGNKGSSTSAQVPQVSGAVCQ